MNSDGVLRSGILAMLLVTGTPYRAFPRQSPQLSQAVPNAKMNAAASYADVHSYIDESLPDLKKTIHELAGLKPTATEEQPADLLKKVGVQADELLHRLPNLIAEESVSETQQPMNQVVLGCTGSACEPPGHIEAWDETFNYLILTHPTEDGQTVVKEYRMKGNGKPIVAGNLSPNFQGFISTWIVFSSPNQVESRFRCLGQQTRDGHRTWAIGFAQIPAVVRQPAMILVGTQSLTMFLQGIAWVDQSDFSIVRLRTDLLAPQPETSVRRLAANIVFGPAHISGIDVTLWLPQSVHAEMESGGQLVQEQHKYSKYRLYQASSRIIPVPQ
jgi:hypothetical protein